MSELDDQTILILKHLDRIATGLEKLHSTLDIESISCDIHWLNLRVGFLDETIDKFIKSYKKVNGITEE